MSPPYAVAQGEIPGILLPFPTPNRDHGDSLRD